MIKFNDDSFFYSFDENNNVMLGNKEKQIHCNNAIFIFIKGIKKRFLLLLDMMETHTL